MKNINKQYVQGIINAPFHLGQKVFEESSFPLANIINGFEQPTFKCNNCQVENSFELELDKSGHWAGDLCLSNIFIEKEELLATNAVRINNIKGREHHGELLVGYLPAVYEKIECNFCKKPFVCFFSYGEIQPGRESLQISGIWEMNF